MNKTSGDPAEYTSASYWPDLSSLDSERDELLDAIRPHQPHPSLVDAFMSWYQSKVTIAERRRQADAVRQVLAFLAESRNPKKTLWALLYAAGLECLQGAGITETARDIAHSKQNLNKEIQRVHDTLMLPRSRYLKSEQSRASYSTAQTQKHFRRKTGKEALIALCPATN